MHERYQAGIVHQSMEPQSEAITARPESGRSGIPEKRSSQLIKRAKDALENSKAKGVRSFAAATILASSILGACKFENENGNPPPPGLTPIERTLPPGVATSNPNPTELPTVIVTPITPIEGTEKPNPTEIPGTETPTATETVVETPTVTETPSVTPTPETPTPTETPVESELPYEIGWEMTVGNVTLAVTKDMQERTECKSPYGGDSVTACPAMQELELNTTDFPDASDKLQEGVKFGLYKAWIEQGQGDKSEREQMTFEDFKAELENNEGKDLTFQVSGIRRSGDSDVTGLITIDPRKPINFVWIAQPETYSTINNGVQIGVREANDRTFLEIFDFSAAGVGDDRQDYHIPSQYYAATKMEFILAYLSSNTLQTSNPDTNAVKNIVPLAKEFDQYLIPEKTDQEWNSILRTK